MQTKLKTSIRLPVLRSKEYLCKHGNRLFGECTPCDYEAEVMLENFLEEGIDEEDLEP